MLSRNVFALSMLALSTTAMADSIDLNLRNSAAQFQYSTAMGRDALGNTELHVGALYSNASNVNNTLVDLGIAVKDELGDNAPGFSVGVGIKGLVGHTAGTNESAIALGGMLRYSPPDLSRMGIIGQVYVSPNITTFGDADRYVETGLRVEYQVIPSAAAYIGYRDIKFNLNTGPNVTVDQGVFVGVRMSF